MLTFLTSLASLAGLATYHTLNMANIFQLLGVGGLNTVTGWRPVKPSAMPEAIYSIPQFNRKPGLRLGHVPSRPAFHALAGHEGHFLFFSLCSRSSASLFCFLLLSSFVL
jgi:hypothetical protein